MTGWFSGVSPLKTPGISRVTRVTRVHPYTQNKKHSITYDTHPLTPNNYSPAGSVTTVTLSLALFIKQFRVTGEKRGVSLSVTRADRVPSWARGKRYDYKGGGSAVLPVATWQVEDVWAYHITHGLPWLSIYDKMGPSARNGLVGRSGEEFGRIEFLRQHYPDVWRWAHAKGIV